MSTNNLTARTITKSPAQSKSDPIFNIIERIKPQMAIALPASMSAERVARIALTEMRINKKLAYAAQENTASFMGAMLKASAIGMEIGNGLGHAYLVPYNTETQLIIGYRGMIELARRSGQIESIYAVEVYEGEHFEVSLGLEQNIVHRREFTGQVKMTKDKVIAVYSVARLKGGMVQFDVMTTAQIEAIRSRSKSKNDGPWVTDWVEMAKKTVLRRLFKMLPVSVEVKTKNDTQAVSLETIANDDAGIVIDNSGVIGVQHYESLEEETETNI
jgi:recombination protein RecT